LGTVQSNPNIIHLFSITESIRIFFVERLLIVLSILLLIYSIIMVLFLSLQILFKYARGYFLMKNKMFGGVRI